MRRERVRFAVPMASFPHTPMREAVGPTLCATSVYCSTSIHKIAIGRSARDGNMARRAYMSNGGWPLGTTAY